MTTDELLYDVREGIGWITFNRPAARNSLTFAMYERLAEICEAARDDRALKALVLTGTGEKAFAAGTDISQFREFRTAEDAFAYEARIDRVLGALETVPQPTIAAISGACTGGGAAIAACCDLRIAAANMRFGFPVARTLGNMPVDEQLRAAQGPDRPGPHQGPDLHRAPDRGGRGPGPGLRERDPARPRRADGARRRAVAPRRPRWRR